MGPPKRKGSTRRQVLDLQGREESPSRLTWQSKYEQILSTEVNAQNGSPDRISSTTSNKTNALSELVGNYSSDSDEDGVNNKDLDTKVEDFLKEIQTINPNSARKPTNQPTPPSNSATRHDFSYHKSLTNWQQCYDENSGFPYFWNTETNEVTWEIPDEVRVAIATYAKTQQQQKSQKPNVEEKAIEEKTEEKKPVKRYPWEESDSEDEKIEMITSFGPQSDDETNQDEERTKVQSKAQGVKVERKKAVAGCSKTMFGPELPQQLTEEAESVQEQNYETSLLLTHVTDDGPPGADVSSSQTDDEQPKKITSEICSQDVNSNDSESDSLLEKLKRKAEILEKMGGELPGDLKTLLESANGSPPMPLVNGSDVVQDDGKIGVNGVDDVIALIERETPPDYPVSDAKSTKPASNPFALIKDYGADSDEETTPKKPLSVLFPIESYVESTSKIELPAVEDNKLLDSSLPDSTTTTHKAFKRKKWIEFDNSAPSTSRAQPSVPSTSTGITHSYSTDSNSNERRGFGFSRVEDDNTNGTGRAKVSAGIQFIKAETIHLPTEAKSQEVPGDKSKNKEIKTSKTASKELEDTAKLVGEKIKFLAEGQASVSPVQLMAIQLETLVSAWHAGAVLHSYMTQWLSDTNSDISRHEKAAAPSGWTCCWDRKNRRYFYRNILTKSTQWEYPRVVVEPDVVGGGDEMELCDSPPPPPSPVDADGKADVGARVYTPPPPSISASVDSAPGSPVAPPPPRITQTADKTVMSTKRKKIEEVSSTSEVSSVSLPAVPPLPPLPPPPPPSEPPPPLPVEPDQPLPPGVDDTEYTTLRRVSSPKTNLPPPPPPAINHLYQQQVAMYHQSVSSTNGLQYHQLYTNSNNNNINLVIQSPPAKKSRTSLTSELDSFYSDLAKLETSAEPPQPQELPPLPPPQPPVPSSSLDDKPVCSPPPEPATSKKKKKTKLTPGLSMKKKKVSSLVAKWQQVQEEVRRDYDADDRDEGDNVSSTHR